MEVSGLDHLVLTVRDVEVTVAFYERALGMRAFSFAGGRRALAFGDQKINLHPLGGEFLPNARAATPGSADVCFLTSVPIERVRDHSARREWRSSSGRWPQTEPPARSSPSMCAIRTATWSRSRTHRNERTAARRGIWMPTSSRCSQRAAHRLDDLGGVGALGIAVGLEVGDAGAD
jgi:hypothetical protein